MDTALKNQLLYNIPCIVLCFKLFIIETSGSNQATNFESNTAFDNHTCYSQDTLFNFTRISSAVWCAHVCAENEACQTIFFHEKDRTCHGCTARYSAESLPYPSLGFKHFQKVEKECEDGWTKFKDSCYSLGALGTFQDGVEYCEASNAHPVYIETSDENEFLKIFLATDPSLIWYIGMTDSGQEGVWRYYGTNELVDFLNFGQSQPDDDATNSQQCGLLVGGHGYDFQMADHFCTDLFPTTCEKVL